jgi:putative endonuclease
VPSQTQNVGKQAEEFAADYLQERGFRIIDRNWRCRWGELDLIAREGEQMVFIRLLKTAWQYLETVGKLDSEWRFDLIAIDLNAEGENHFINHYQHVIEDSEH